ncbi:Polyprotein P3 [Nymphaea thermarum]|nr:Polyprotein P3 [Nymphaea thermarum]
MNDNPSVKKALSLTNVIEPPSVAYAKPTEYSSVGAATSILIRQNNTIIQLITQVIENQALLTSKLSDLSDQLKSATTKGENLPDSLIDELGKKFNSLSLGKTAERRGKLHVIKDPYTILADEKKKIKDGAATILATTQPEFEDQIRNYRTGQRRRLNLQRRINSLMRRNYHEVLEEQLQPEQQLARSLRERANMVPAEVLYSARSSTNQHRVYQHLSEEAISCLDDQQVDRPFIQPESYQALNRSNFRFIHVGLAQVRLQILHRRDEGTQALVVFRDNRWQNDQAIFATMEVDLSRGNQIIFIIPDTILTLRDFYHHFQISIQTRGYNNWRNGEANLILTRGLIGRLSNTPNMAFAYQINHVTDYLASHGVTAIPGRRISSHSMQGLNWVVRPSTASVPMQPTGMESMNLIDGRIAVRFSDYGSAATLENEEAEITEHTILVLLSTDEDEEEEEDEMAYYQYLAMQAEAEQLPEYDYFKVDPGELPEPCAGEEKVFVLNEYDYPQMRGLSNIIAASAASGTTSAQSPYNPPADISMSMHGYAPATGRTPPIRPIIDAPSSSRTKFKGGRNDEMWNLPTAAQTTGVLFVIPTQIGLFHDVFSRWESITKNLVSEKGFADPKDKAEFIENLLGEIEKLIWIAWRMEYQAEYEALIAAADGRQGTQNILSQMRQVFSLEDPTQGTTGIQDQAYRDLERLSCSNIKYIIQYMNDYLRLAAKSGRMFISPELSEKFWVKMPGDLGNRVKQAFDARYPGVNIALTPRILFTYQYLEQECKDAAFKRSLKNLSFCSQIPIPGYYRDPERKNDAIYSISENEDIDESLEHQIQTLSINMLGEQYGGYRPQIKLPSEQMNCSHQWQYNSQVDNPTCVCCKKETIARARISCPQCLVVACNLCGPYYFQKAVPVEPAPYTAERPSSFHKLILQQSEYIVWCDAEISRLKRENQYLRDQMLLNHLSKDLEELTLADDCRDQKGKDILHTETNCFIVQAEAAHAAAGGGGKIIRNRLYNLTAQIEIPGVETFSVRAILDTGATTCCIDENSIPKDALEDNTFTVQFTGVNSQQNANKKLKRGQMAIGENQFRIPYTYAFPMSLGGEIQLIIGCNFIRAMQGGLRIEGDIITLYKGVTTINTQQQAVISSLAEEIDDLEYIQTQESVLYTAGPTPPKFKIKFQPIIENLKAAGYIGEDPLKHWSKNKVTCKITLKNPDFIIEDRPLKHVTPQMKESFSGHIESLLKLGVIRPSNSQHRTTAIILPTLSIPPAKCFIILETDGCMEGWGGICKWKPQKYDSRSMERPCAYASGKFSPPKSTIDAEIYAVMNSLESLKIYYLEQEEILIRTDCQAIISFFNKTNINKPSRVRWIAFVDFITGLGIDVSFEHIHGKDNVLADSLSRLITLLIGSQTSYLEPQLLTAFELCLQEWQDHPGPPPQQQKFQCLCNQVIQLLGDTQTSSTSSMQNTAMRIWNYPDLVGINY